MAFLIVEYEYESPVTDDELAANSAKVSPCLDARGIKWVQSYVASDRKRGLCVFEAADAESVRESFRRANVRFQRVWPAFAPWS